MTNKDLFLRLATPDDNGCSRWVSKDEFIGDYSDLAFNNGFSWGRSGSALDKEYKIEVRRNGREICEIRLVGFKTEPSFNQNIRRDIKDFYKDERCVMLGIKGKSINTKIEIDHKNGRKNDPNVANLETQQREDFQPLCKAANDAKRQICKECRETNERWNAQNIKGNLYPFYKGDNRYTEEIGCEGCFQYDPVAYRKESIRKFLKEDLERQKALFKETFSEDLE
ncbi:hypothetical protein [Alloprevotella tannerae]|uniref:hypothetical protein n=1 Tax=Alloprevotella tannerae TaxID=76122 RepID=UPI00241D3E54|nr:hypothetical protein [Alloprevotella tannerae]